MIAILQYTGLVVAGELLLHMLLYLISKWIGKPNRDRITRASFIKGVIERLFVVVVLRMEITSALTLLAALKIATRFKEEDNKVTNDFFLIGNLLSILFGVGYFVLLKAEF